MLAATDYFTKWVEAILLKVASSTNVIEFVKEHIIYRFGIPQSITTDQGSMFISREFEDYASSTGFKLVNSSPYYAQANGQAEASNQILIKLIKKKIDKNPWKWHTILNETLWSYRMAYHGATKCSSYELVYGHEAVLPWEINISSRRVLQQNELKADDYRNLMMDDLDDLNLHRLKALENIEAQKLRVAKYYNWKVREKRFIAGELVWKVILPIGTQNSKYGKWSPNWEGPYRITRGAPGNAYFYETLEGREFSRAVNEIFFKKYYPSIWVDLL
jgi:hypothetical protein